jgi:two-component system sensor histidine kinase PilS (NtrC family)
VVPIYVLTERRAVARVGLSLASELAEIRATRNLVVGLGVVALVAGFGVAAWQARSVTRPLGELVQGARHIAEGNLDHRIATHGAGEIDHLGAAFNGMAEALGQRIEEVKGAQDELVRKTRLAAMGEIAAVMAHETRTPLGALSNCVQMLRTDATIGGENRELLDMIKAEADRLNGIVSDFLAYGRPRAPMFQPVDLHESIDDALAVLRRDERCAPSIAVARDFAAPSATVHADPHQLRQVFWNVLLNAVQAMSGHGTLTVETRQDDGRVQIAVVDTGPGIAAADVARLFEPFQTRRPGGIGLGLATVRRIVEDHGGRVSLASTPGTGTRVLIELPRG